MVESGIFYGTIVDPVLTPLRKKVTGEIISGQNIIDIACGTGAQLFDAAKLAAQITGVDLSESMINYANKKAKKLGVTNAEFLVADATHLSMFKDMSFDTAIMSLALHQFNPEQYNSILGELNRIANSIILVDYAVPLPQNFSGRGSRVAEFFAGREHFKNFNRFLRLGGLNKILPEHNLKIKKTNYMAWGAFQMVICTGTN